MKPLKSRVTRVTKSWLSHLDKSGLSGSRDIPPQLTVKAVSSEITQKVMYAVKQTMTDAPGSKQYLRIYEQNIHERLLSTQMSQPEVKSVDAQIVP